MLRDGIYRISYPGTPASSKKPHTALASSRNGRIFASDEHGGIYHGLQDRDQDGAAGPVQVVVKIPPESELVTGHAAKDGAVVLRLPATLNETCDSQTAVALLNDVPLEIEICYLGPLPG